MTHQHEASTLLSYYGAPPGAVVIKNTDRGHTLWVGYWKKESGRHEVYAGVDPAEVSFAIRRIQLGLIN